MRRPSWTPSWILTPYSENKKCQPIFSISWDIQDNITIVFITKNILLNKDILLSLLKCAFNCSLSLLAITNKRWLYCNGHFYVVKLYFFIIFLSCHCIHFSKHINKKNYAIFYFLDFFRKLFLNAYWFATIWKKILQGR